MKKAGKIILWILITIAVEVGCGYLMALGVNITRISCDFVKYLASCAGCAGGVTLFMLAMFMLVGFPFVGLDKIVKVATNGKGIV